VVAEKEKHRITVSLDEETFENISRIAHSSHVSIDWVIRYAVEFLLEKRVEGQQLLLPFGVILYDIKLYDTKSDTFTFVVSLPERRLDHERARGRMTIGKWAKSLLGEDWWLKNWHNISITESNHNHWKGIISRSKAIRPPREGGVE